MKRKKTVMHKIIATILSLVLILPINTLAAQPESVTPCASSYIGLYDGSISPQGNGEIKIYFSITGTGTMDDIGVTSIVLYESEDDYDYFAVKTYYSSSYSNLMGSDTAFHSSSVTYQGKADCYYEAHICYYAGDETGGDARQIYTKIVQAT